MAGSSRRMRAINAASGGQISRRRLLAGGLGIGAAGASLLAPLRARPVPAVSAAAFDAAGQYELLCRVAENSALAAHVAPGSLLLQPEERRAVNGLLETTLRAARGQTTIAGRPVISSVYEGIFPGPALRLRQGETLKVHLANALDQPTNLHFHGAHVTPGGNGDNIFVHVEPGETFTYQYDLPRNHPSGLCWYHPHAHGTNEVQVFSGMAGAIIIEGEIDDHPAIAGLPERLLFLQTTSITPDGQTFDVNEAHNTGVTEKYGVRTINGQLQPLISIRPGETQRWRIANASANDFFRLSLEGHQFHLIARDGNPMSRVQTLDEVLLGPGQRREVLVLGGAPGSYLLKTLEFKGRFFETDPETVMAYVVVAGPAQEPRPLPATLFPSPDLRGLPVDERRRFSLTIEQTADPNEPLFLVAGRVFDADRVDVVTHLDALEEWTIVNPSHDFHPFHIHINDFQTIAIDGEPVDNFGLEDTVLVPPNGGSMTMRTRFEDFTGRLVWHCHILRHEERGMMQVIEIRPPDGSPPPTPQPGHHAGTLRRRDVTHHRTA